MSEQKQRTGKIEAVYLGWTHPFVYSEMINDNYAIATVAAVTRQGLLSIMAIFAIVGLYLCIEADKGNVQFKDPKTGIWHNFGAKKK